MPQISPTQLRTALSKLFSTGELRTLCFDLGIEYEDLEGAGKSGKALALVQYGQRHGRYDELVYRVQQLRPHADLGTAVIATPITPAGNASKQDSKQEIHYHISGDMVGGDKVGGDSVAGDKISVGNISGSSNIAIGHGASITSGDTITAGGDVSKGDMTKQTAGGDMMTAGGDITINANPENKAEFNETLAALKQLLEKALAEGEFEDPRDGEDALSELGEVAAEAKSEKPRESAIKRKLGSLADILGGTASVAEAAGKVGTAVLKATPIIAGLIKAASIIF